MIFNIENFYHEKEKEIRKEISNEWEKLDYILFKNKNQKYKVVKFKKRKLITKFGVINYKRRIYKYYSTEVKKWMYVALLDQELKIKKYKRIYKDLYTHIFSFLGDGKRYKDIKDTTNSNISLMTISRIFQQHNLKTKEIKKISLQNKQKLYINIDDCFVTTKINSLGNTCKIRPVSFSTGIKNGKLQNKRISFEIKKSDELNKNYYLNCKDSILWIKEELSRFYKNWENADLILGGDGANWITTIGKNLNATQVLSKFHVIQHARNSFLLINNNNYKYIDYSSYKLFWKAINNFDLKEALLNLKKYKLLLESKKSFPDKLRKTNIFICYIKNNWEAFLNYSKDWNIGVSAESDVFHLVKQAVNGRAYNFNTLINILIARANKINSRI